MRPDLPCLILASASPRRVDLLRQVGIEPAGIDPADIDEKPNAKDLPRPYAARMAEAKARVVAGRHPDAFVLAADTVVARGRRILPKPETEAEARQCLALLSGARHRVFGGITVIAPGGRVAGRVVQTIVAFKRLGPGDVGDYVAEGEWVGKAGGYAIQGRAAAFVRSINGSYTNIVGLPLFETVTLLTGLGYR